ncbi:arginase family protein [Brumimicrobium aurantiacum]|uniref:Arginase n=1 Tax=Brumimicrobium aurantiacum TaxID=1737063 RepID=A0A3E1F0M5_9FLAO|nr:arginase family protein [Brumimicrobium aurantiacum]RFC55267.1 hypothetical protein DXU93_05450 [Brumimicrobium aurantiacum]
MKSKHKSFEFSKLRNSDILNHFSPRDGEQKLGEVINNSSNSKFVILGIEESIGPIANKGRKGAENGFKAFLNTFLNMQSNEYLNGEEICILGKVSRIDENKNSKNGVEELDDFIYSVLKEYIGEGQIPIIIGGGHNNAYPLIHFSAKRYDQKIDVVNFDAHADYRLLEGRHSGNPFSYAYRDEYLDRYTVFGLHQRYNSQQILNDLRRDQHTFTFHEEYLMKERNYYSDFKKCFSELDSNKYLGVELDLDVISRMPSSAFTPVGVEIDDCRRYLKVFGKCQKLAYLHLPEGAPMDEYEDRIVGKALAYFVSDFVSSYLSRSTE